MENGKVSSISIDMKSKATQTKGTDLIWYKLCHISDDIVHVD